MRIKDEIFCFAHLRWCHNGWASNILIVVDTGYAGIHHSKYWMPIHYDTIEDGQNKKSHLLFSKLKSYSLYNSSCQQGESDINFNAQFTHLQVWTLYQNTHINLVLQSIFARKRNVYRHTPTNRKINTVNLDHRPTDCNLCLAFRLWALV